MSDRMRQLITAAVFFWTILLGVFVYYTGREANKFREDTRTEMEAIKRDTADIRKRLAHLEYVNRRVEEYDRQRGKGVKASEATKKAAEAP